jgi:hypothetical protein
MNSTARRVPRITGLPASILGSMTMRSNGGMRIVYRVLRRVLITLVATAAVQSDSSSVEFKIERNNLDAFASCRQVRIVLSDCKTAACARAWY